MIVQKPLFIKLTFRKFGERVGQSSPVRLRYSYWVVETLLLVLAEVHGGQPYLCQPFKK